MTVAFDVTNSDGAFGCGEARVSSHFLTRERPRANSPHYTQSTASRSQRHYRDVTTAFPVRGNTTDRTGFRKSGLPENPLCPKTSPPENRILERVFHGNSILRNHIRRQKPLATSPLEFNNDRQQRSAPRNDGITCYATASPRIRSHGGIWSRS